MVSLLIETWRLQKYRKWSKFIQPEYILVSAQRSFATKTPHPPPWQDGNLLQGYSQQYVTGTQSYTWMKRDKVKQFSCLRKQPEDKIFNPQIYLYRVQI